MARLADIRVRVVNPPLAVPHATARTRRQRPCARCSRSASGSSGRRAMRQVLGRDGAWMVDDNQSLSIDEAIHEAAVARFEVA
jgi:hypothetical protein